MIVKLSGYARAMLLAFALFGLACSQAVAQEPVTVFAAASMKNALDAANAAWVSQDGPKVSVSYAASSALARQVEAGAPADIYISADRDWMDYLAERKLIKDESRGDLLGNRLVLIGTQGAAPVKMEPGFDLAGLLAGGKLAMASPDSVPAGKYGKAALETLGVWPSVEASVAGAENVRAALLLVSRGEAPFGIVYQTDAVADPGVTVVATFPEDTHPPIVYPVALVASSDNPQAGAYLEFLKSEKAKPLFEAQGFTVLH